MRVGAHHLVRGLTQGAVPLGGNAGLRYAVIRLCVAAEKRVFVADMLVDAIGLLIGVYRRRSGECIVAGGASAIWGREMRDGVVGKRREVACGNFVIPLAVRWEGRISRRIDNGCRTGDQGVRSRVAYAQFRTRWNDR